MTSFRQRLLVGLVLALVFAGLGPLIAPVIIDVAAKVPSWPSPFSLVPIPGPPDSLGGLVRWLVMAVVGPILGLVMLVLMAAAAVVIFVLFAAAQAHAWWAVGFVLGFILAGVRSYHRG